MNLLGDIHQQESIEKQIDELENKRTVPDKGIDNVEKKEKGMTFHFDEIHFHHSELLYIYLFQT